LPCYLQHFPIRIGFISTTRLETSVTLIARFTVTAGVIVVTANVNSVFAAVDVVSVVAIIDVIVIVIVDPATVAAHATTVNFASFLVLTLTVGALVAANFTVTRIADSDSNSANADFGLLTGQTILNATLGTNRHYALTVDSFCVAE